MKDLSYVSTDSSIATSTPVPANKEARRPLRKWLVWSAPMLVWALLLVGSFFLAKHYINGLQQQMIQIQTSTEDLNRSVMEFHTQLGEHKESLAGLQSQFDHVQSDLEAVKEELSLAGNTLTSSDQTRQALNERISDLSKELENLRGSITKLEEATRAY
ncbi:hypothetical protein [Paenibacillus sp. J2TS4]|uniref:hypothetical protein n=1 Tax=Paenibacillus sp. J2TS4 TaxID=2807194 RepID=UPI001B042ED5|nr:hypothetical protein [Paenibacillus sp. J2TS4]GIP31157.1 hypothetical protein J2TS4_03670 [Paenibacillus sp. J2TS4]